MKHTLKITIILLIMFLVTQLIGLAVINAYSPIEKTVINESSGAIKNITIQQPLPYGMEAPEVEKEISFISIAMAFFIAVILILILTKYRWKFLIRIWFFVVIALALGITFNALLKSYFQYSEIFSLVIAVPIAFLKIYKPRIILHNITELLIYPGIAAVFVPILNIFTVILLLILISIYDIWAVWHTGVMQRMAKFQIEELRIFGGFFVPYISKNMREKLKKLKKSKSKKQKKIKVSLAILGGGDVVFPIITAGVFLRSPGFGLLPALFVIIGALVGLSFLFMRSEKKKFYPAMPFITTGMFLGIIISFFYAGIINFLFLLL